MFGKKRECFIPKREVNWKKYAYLHNRENNIYYDCQCGKRYVSFPAIYLHFQRKHNHKLSTKADPNECKIIKMENQLIHFYEFSQKRPLLQKQNLKQFNKSKVKFTTFIGSIFCDFIKENYQFINNQCNIPFASELFLRLEKFIFCKQRCGENQLQSERQISFNIPLYFNDFVKSQMKNSNTTLSKQYFKLLSILFKFSQWLNIKRISDFIVQINTDENLEKNCS